MAMRTLGTFGVRTAWYDEIIYGRSLFVHRIPEKLTKLQL
jgi:hypothetical protein